MEINLMFILRLKRYISSLLFKIRFYFWERNVTFGEEGKSAQINITISNSSGKELYTLHGYKVIE